MKILAIDTSNVPMSVAVLADTTLLATTTINHERNHSKLLLPLIKQTLKQAGVLKTELDRIVVAIGPGSYTGLRIGVSVAKMLAYALNIPVVPVSSLEILATPLAVLPKGTLVVPVFDARRGNVFAGAWQTDGHQLTEKIAAGHFAFASLIEQATSFNQPVVVVGDAAATLLDHLDKPVAVQVAPAWANFPQAYVAGLLGKDRKPASVAKLVPEYLRLTQAEAQWLETHEQKDADSYVEKY